jgi:hypothetical protein
MRWTPTPELSDLTHTFPKCGMISVLYMRAVTTKSPTRWMHTNVLLNWTHTTNVSTCVSLFSLYSPCSRFALVYFIINMTLRRYTTKTFNASGPIARRRWQVKGRRRRNFRQIRPENNSTLLPYLSLLFLL